MTQNYKFLRAQLVVWLLLFSLAPFSSFAQLSGSYTINPKGSASSTNYLNWQSCIGDLVSGTRTDKGTANGSGVKGAVVVTVADQLYTSTQISIGAISGVSSSNTITFQSDGGDSTKCVLQAASTTSAGKDYVLQLNGADYIIFKNIGFEITGSNTYSTVIDITNDADYNHFINCSIKGRKVPSNSSTGFASGVGSCFYFTGNGDYTVIDNCRIIYGYNGIYGATSCTNNWFKNNIIDTAGSSGIYFTGQTNFKIEANTFYMGDFGPSTGHYTSYGMRIESSPAMQIFGNKLYMYAKNGQVVRAIMLASTTSTAAAPARVYNNWVVNEGGTGDCTGFALYACYYVDIFYNNVLISNSLKAGSAYYHYAAYTNSNIQLVNNNFINKGGGYAYNVPGSNTADLSRINYNNVYTSGSYLGNWNGTDYSSFSGWQAGAGIDSNSVNSDPGYISSKNLHVTNNSINAKATPFKFIKTDIDGDSRSSTTPDIGADEFSAYKLDVGISSIDSPRVFCPGKRNVKVIFQNFGSDTIKGVTIGWSVNGKAQGTVGWTGKLSSGNSSNPIMLGSYTFVSNTSYTFKIWTTNPNKGTDDQLINDTITITRYPGMSGTYSIGGKTGDYKGFNAAITDMTARGICGPLTFNVADGVYKEQLTLVQLDGMGPTNPVVFQGVSKDSSKVLITLPSTTANGNNNAACQLRGADYVTFKHITFRRTGSNQYATVLHILGGSNNNSFEHCQMIGTRVTSASATAYNIWSDQGRDTGNVFHNNYIKLGTSNMWYSGIGLWHETYTVVTDNIFDSAYNNAVQISDNDNLTFSGNLFKNIRTPIAGNMDLELYQCDLENTITGNYFYDSQTETALSLNDCFGTASETGLIANNFFVKTNGKAIRFDGASYIDILHNSFNFNGISDTNAAVTTLGSCSKIQLLNNNIFMKTGMVLRTGGKLHLSVSDNNNLYTKGKYFAEWGGTIYKSLGALINASKKDSHSISVIPYYSSFTDLHAKNTALNGAGKVTSRVTTDIDGDSRSSTPDIGADEFNPVGLDAGISTVSEPSDLDCEGEYDIKAVIKNFGSSTLTDATINWTLDGKAQTAVKWKGSLTNLQTDVVNLGKHKFSGISTTNLVLWTSDPNGKADQFTPNDTLIATKLLNEAPTAAGGSDKKVCSGDSINIGTPGAAGYSYQWSVGATVAGTKAVIYVKPTKTTKYVFTVTRNSSGCKNYDTVLVTVGNYPKVNAGTSQTICEGITLKLGSTPITGHSYSWVSSPVGFTSTDAQPTVKPTVKTTYTLTETEDNSNCKSSGSVTIGINASPKPAAVGNVIVCEGDNASYETDVVSGDTYEWLIEGGAINSGKNQSTVNVTWDTAATAAISVVETNAKGCTDTSSLVVLINPDPQADFQIGSLLCAGKPVDFNDKSIGGNAVKWNFGDGTKGSSTSVKHNFATAGDYNVSLVATSVDGCKDSIDKMVSILVIPKPAFEVDGNLCENSSITLKTTSTDSGVSTWVLEDGSRVTQKDVVHSFSKSGTNAIRLVMDNGGCKDSIKQDVVVNALSDAGFTISVLGKSVKCAAKAFGAKSYTWKFSDGQTADIANPTHTFDIDKGWFYMTLTVINASDCESQKKDSAFIDVTSVNEVKPGVNLHVFPNPFSDQLTIEFSSVDNGDLLCELVDLTGKQLGVVYRGTYSSGLLQIQLNSSNFNITNGMYLLRFSLNNEYVSRQLIMVK